MRWNFLPRQPYFFDAFVSMTSELKRGVALLLEMLDNSPPRVELQPRIHEVENACDAIASMIQGEGKRRICSRYLAYTFKKPCLFFV